MKKRVSALILALALLFTLAPAPGAAAETVYFTAGDENVLDLTDATMPFWFGGYLYVAASLFQECGLGYSPNTVRQTVVLHESSRSLIFNLAENSATDGQGNPFDYGAVLRNNAVFVPARPVADFFGRKYSYTQVAHGSLIRVSSDAGMDSAIFADSAASTMEQRYQSYLRSKTSAGADAQTPSQKEDPQPPAAGKTLYLCLEAQDTELSGQWLDALEAWGAHGSFYFGEEALSRSGALLRRLAALGQSIGLIVSPGGETPEQQLFRMNRVLFDAAGVKTRLVLLRDGTDGETAALEAAGYCPLAPRMDRSEYGLTTSGGAAALLKQAAAWRGSVSVWLGSDVTAGGLRALLSAAKEGDHRLLAMTETAG